MLLGKAQAEVQVTALVWVKAFHLGMALVWALERGWVKALG
jgi:hypothetical protein